MFCHFLHSLKKPTVPKIATSHSRLFNFIKYLHLLTSHLKCVNDVTISFNYAISPR